VGGKSFDGGDTVVKVLDDGNTAGKGFNGGVTAGKVMLVVEMLLLVTVLLS
jgi:hypothetical protein